ncbi:MAG: Ig-like domain-containing protein [Pseudomonadota bacterium]|nr:Ig-like domain-containing protein [Pseudomonadota bacterium]
MNDTVAQPPATSGTRYFSSDDRIASVSDTGLITAHAAGHATLSIVHLASRVDANGTLSEQAIGQSDIPLTVQAAQLTDTDPATPAPQGIEIAKDLGGVVSAATGETVLIGAGALDADTVVAIHRLDLASLAAPPAAGLLQAVAAFALDLGRSATRAPVQLVLPLQGDAQIGEEVLFFRKGTVPTADGGSQATWWLVDNGLIGADAQGNLLARSASPPYKGVDTSGEYMVVRRLPGVIGSPFD